MYEIRRAMSLMLAGFYFYFIIFFIVCSFADS